MDLAAYLDHVNLSASAFAAKVGVPASTITRILSGQRLPRMDTVRRIVAATDGRVSVDSFMKPPPPAPPEAVPASSSLAAGDALSRGEAA